jgi:hypothetical protein
LVRHILEHLRRPRSEGLYERARAGQIQSSLGLFDTRCLPRTAYLTRQWHDQVIVKHVQRSPLQTVRLFFPHRQELFLSRHHFALGDVLEDYCDWATIRPPTGGMRRGGNPPLWNDQALDACSVDCSSCGRLGPLLFCWCYDNFDGQLFFSSDPSSVAFPGPLPRRTYNS